MCCCYSIILCSLPSVKFPTDGLRSAEEPGLGVLSYVKSTFSRSSKLNCAIKRNSHIHIVLLFIGSAEVSVKYWNDRQSSHDLYLELLRKSKVDEFDISCSVQQQVLGLKISVDRRENYFGEKYIREQAPLVLWLRKRFPFSSLKLSLAFFRSL